MSDTVALSGITGVTELIATGGILCALSGSDLYLYDFATAAWSPIEGAGPFLCSDGQYLWGGDSGSISIFDNQQWSPILEAFLGPGTEFASIVAANAVLYVKFTNGTVGAAPFTPSGTQTVLTPVLNLPSGTLVTNQMSLYVWSSTEVSEYVNGNWVTDLVAPQGIQFTSILTVENQVLLLGSDNNLYGYDSNLKTSLPPLAGFNSSSSVQYAFTPLVLVALSAGSLYYFDPKQETWQTFNAGGPQITSIFGGGAMPYGVDNDGNVYVLSPAALSAQVMSKRVKGPAPQLTLASVPSSNYQGWMTYLASQFPAFAGLSIGQICIPGSHDSGSYEFSIWQQIGVVGTMAQTQSLDIAGQLGAGARFFDIRPGSDNSGNLYIYHGSIETNVPFGSVLEAVSQFVQNNPGEIVILYLNHIDAQDQPSVDSAVAGAFQPGQVFPTSSPTGLASITYGQLREGGWSVILLADSPTPSSPNYWPSSLIADLGSYADSADVLALMNFINSKMPQSSPASPWMLQCQLTPGVWQGVTCASLRLSPLASLIFPGPGPLSMAGESKALVQSRLDPQQHQDSAQYLNLFIVDDYDTSWTDLAYTINLTRVQAG